MKNTAQALGDLEKELGHPLQAEVPGLMDVPDRLQIDMKKLKSYLNWALKLHSKGIENKSGLIV